MLRNAWRLATALRGDLVAVAVKAENAEVLQREVTLAEGLGAGVRQTRSIDLAMAISEIVREERAAAIVMRHERKAGWRRRLERSLADMLFDQLDNVAIHLVEMPSVAH